MVTTPLQTSGFIVVYVDSLELEIGVTVVGAGGVYTVLVWDHLPELKHARTHI